MKIYTAHPITGLSGAEVIDYFDNIRVELKGLTVLSPMTGKGYLRAEPELKANGYTHLSSDHAIFQRDTWMVSQADMVLVDFTGAQRVSIGCCMELGIAAHLGKHTIVVMSEDNIHRHGFVMDAADVIFETLDEAIVYLKNF